MKMLKSSKEAQRIKTSIQGQIDEYSEMVDYERLFLIDQLLIHKPKKILEVGVSAGGSSAIILSTLKEIGHGELYSVDLGTQWYKDPSLETGWLIEDKFPELLDKYNLHTGALVHEFMDQIGDGIDFCLFDTVHSNPGEILDFLSVFPYLTKNCTVLFHDIALHTDVHPIKKFLRVFATTNCSLMSGIIGEKIVPDIPTAKNLVSPNIGAIQLQEDSNQLFNCFNLLLLPWVYMISEKQYQDLKKHYSRFYSKDLIELFERVYNHNIDNFDFFPNNSNIHRLYQPEQRENKWTYFGTLSRIGKIKWLVKNSLKKLVPNKIFNALKLLKNSPKDFVKKCLLIFLYKQDMSFGGGYNLYIKGTNNCVLRKRFDRLSQLRYQKNLSLDEEKEVIQIMYYDAHQVYLDLDNPKTYNEKINWLKLYNRNPLITMCSDKVAVREYIKEKIGEEHLIPSLGVWDKATDIDFDALPNQFVLKVNWGSGQNIIVRDKSQLNIAETIKQLNRWMQSDYNIYHWNMEWGYKNITPKIIAEVYLDEFETVNPADYKIFCFNGNPYMMMYVSGRGSQDHERSFYSLPEWRQLPFAYEYPKYNMHDKPEQKSAVLDRILELSTVLAQEFDFVRVDWYIINGKINFGELTFYHGAGMETFSPKEWNLKLGDMIKLPPKNRT